MEKEKPEWTKQKRAAVIAAAAIVSVIAAVCLLIAGMRPETAENSGVTGAAVSSAAEEVEPPTEPETTVPSTSTEPSTSTSGGNKEPSTTKPSGGGSSGGGSSAKPTEPSTGKPTEPAQKGWAMTADEVVAYANSYIESTYKSTGIKYDAGMTKNNAGWNAPWIFDLEELNDVELNNKEYFQSSIRGMCDATYGRCGWYKVIIEWKNDHCFELYCLYA